MFCGGIGCASVGGQRDRCPNLCGKRSAEDDDTVDCRWHPTWDMSMGTNLAMIPSSTRDLAQLSGCSMMTLLTLAGMGAGQICKSNSEVDSWVVDV